MPSRFRMIGGLLLSAALIISACGTEGPSPAPGQRESGEQPVPEQPAPAQPEPSGEYTVLAQNLRTPWAMDFHEETVYISERGGHVVELHDGNMKRLPVQTALPVTEVGEGGFLGLVLSPDYGDTKQAYAYHTYEQDGAILNRVILLEQQEEQWAEVDALIERIPGSQIHNGGRMALGPDNHLYIATGDAGDGALSQDEANLAGKILRMSLSGEIPADNPLPDSYVYSLGHRNPQGLAWNAEGELFITEHGPSGNPGGHDEINQIMPGANYGWPDVIGDEAMEGTIPPLYHTGETAIAPSGAAFDEQGLLVASLRGQTLYRFDPEGGELEVVLDQEGRLRDVKVQDGRVYVLTNNTDGRGVPGEEDDRLLLLP